MNWLCEHCDTSWDDPPGSSAPAPRVALLIVCPACSAAGHRHERSVACPVCADRPFAPDTPAREETP